MGWGEPQVPTIQLPAGMTRHDAIEQLIAEEDAALSADAGPSADAPLAWEVVVAFLDGVNPGTVEGMALEMLEMGDEAQPAQVTRNIIAVLRKLAMP